jgi:hypothetical protein
MHMANATCVIHFVACESRVFVGGWKTRKFNKTNFEGRKRGRGEGDARPLLRVTLPSSAENLSFFIH